jgi:hypothetical protein
MPEVPSDPFQETVSSGFVTRPVGERSDTVGFVMSTARFMD